MKAGSKSEKKQGTLARRVAEWNGQKFSNVAQLSKSGLSRFTLLRFEAAHVGKFHYTAEDLAWRQFEKSSGRRHLIDNSLKMTIAKAN